MFYIVFEVPIFDGLSAGVIVLFLIVFTLLLAFWLWKFIASLVVGG